MVLYKRKTKRVGRKKQMRRKPMARSRPKQPVQFFKRTQYVSSYWTPSAGTDQFKAQPFKLSDLASASEFTSLYDQYQIKAIKISLIPMYDNAQVSSSSVPTPNVANRVFRTFSIIDYDDATAPTSIDQMCQYQNVHIKNNTKWHTRYFRPKVATEIFASGVASGYAPKAGVWIDCNSSGVEHYGVKFGQQSSSLDTRYDAKITYYLAFKNVR